MPPARLAALALALLACGENVGPNNATRLRIRTVTTGVSLDPDGYVLHLRRAEGGEEVRPISVSGFTSFDRLPGTYTATLADVSPNCSLAGAPDRTFNVTGQVSADSTEFDLTCIHANGSISVHTNLPASAGPGPFVVSLRGGDPRPVGAVDSTRFTDLADGVYRVQIDSAKAVPSLDPCFVSTNVAEVVVSGGSSNGVTFPFFVPSSNPDCD